MAVIATATLVSCQQEKSFDDVKLGDNDVVFAFQGSAATKSGESMEQDGVVIPLEMTDGGMLSLVETIVDLNVLSPITKGTPVYTENVGTLYENNLFVTANGFGDATFENMETEMYGGGWRYRHTYESDKWPTKADTPVDFYLQMPANVTDYGVSARPQYSDGTISFSYTSKPTAAEQRDLIFSYRSLTKDQHKTYLPAGAPVLFHHALSGVKFRVANSKEELGDKQIKITRVEFIGLKNTGDCVVTPRKEKDQEDYTDNRTGDYSSGDYSSADAILTSGTVAWTNTRATSATNTIYQTFEEEGVEYIQDFESGDGNNFAPSYYEGGADQNLNKSDASLTFWMIPQSFNGSQAKLHINYEIYDKLEGVVKPKEATIELGEKLANAIWKAGELRTYTIKINDVGVDITDEITVGEKKNVSFSNTGNTAEFIRVKIVGNWVDDENHPFVGYTYGTEKRNVAEEGEEAKWEFVVVDGPNGNVVSATNDTFVTPWTLSLNPTSVSYSISGKTYAGGANTTYADAEELGEDGVYGVFSGLPGTNWDWTTKGDGYIYYTQSIAAGASGTSATTALFTKFKIDPYTRYAYRLKDPMTGEREAVEIHLLMDIMVQAIEAKEGETWSDAWDGALDSQNG